MVNCKYKVEYGVLNQPAGEQQQIIWLIKRKMMQLLLILELGKTSNCGGVFVV